MTVKQLMVILAKLPEDAEVWLNIALCCGKSQTPLNPVKAVYTAEDGDE